MENLGESLAMYGSIARTQMLINLLEVISGKEFTGTEIRTLTEKAIVDEFLNDNQLQS